MSEWPETENERVAERLERLARRLRSSGERCQQLAHEFLRLDFPSDAPPEGSRTREDAALAKQERQLVKDCTDYRDGLRLVHDIAADFDERMARILATVGEGDLCSRCGNRIDPKREKAKWWRGSRPMHPLCYQRELRTQGKAS